MLELILLTAGAIGILGLHYGKHILYQPTRINSWDSTQWPIKIVNGISYIYDNSESDIIILFSHGNAGNLTDRQDVRDFCKKHGYGLILYDYLGYGASLEIPRVLMNEYALQKSIFEVYSLILNSNKKIFLIGESLGSYPTCWLASKIKHKISGVILCVPFDQLKTVAGELGSLVLGSHNNLELIKDFTSPTLLIKAEYDEIMPHSCVINLKSNCPVMKDVYTVYTNHCEYFNHYTREAINKFIQEYKS